jgi:outer membrane receptor protein involved in Fe transport
VTSRHISVCRYRSFFGVLSLLGAVLAVPAAAQDAEASTTAQSADTVTDTAAKKSASKDGERVEVVEVVGQREAASELALDLAQFGNQVQIVDSEEIKAAGYTNMAEIAQGLIRGANVGYSPDEGEFTIRLDGGGDRDTLVTLDNMPLYDRGPGVEAIWGATLIDPHMVETIEVFRGGQSLYFGSNAGIGLVNVVTKKPDGTRKGEFGVSYGAFNTREVWGNYAYPLDAAGNHSVMFYGSRTASDHHQIFRREDQVDNILLAGGITDYSNSTDDIGAKYRWTPDASSELLANVQYVKIDFQDTFPNNTLFGPTSTRMPVFNVNYSRQWTADFSTRVTASYRRPELLNTKFRVEVCRNPDGCPQPSNPDKITPYGQWTGNFLVQGSEGVGDNSVMGGFEELVVTVLNDVTFGKSIGAVFGVQSTNYRDVSDSRVLIDDDVVSDNALIADLRVTPSFSPGTSISLAGRIDQEKSFGTETIAKLGLRQELPGGFYLRANGGNSFSLPLTNELYATSETVVGNPDLKPEKTKTLNYGLGMDRPLGAGRLAAELGGFMTDISDRIQTTTGLTPNTRFNNDAVTEIRGVVADVQYTINDNWFVSLSYTQQEAQLENSDQQINATPEWFATGTLRWSSDSKRYHFNLLPRLQGPEWIAAPKVGGQTVAGLSDYNYGDWFLLNASAQYWMGERQEHRFQLRMVNLLDEEYGERASFGNQFYGSAFNRGEISNTEAAYFYPYTFYGKPRSFFVSYSYQF